MLPVITPVTVPRPFREFARQLKRNVTRRQTKKSSAWPRSSKTTLLAWKLLRQNWRKQPTRTRIKFSSAQISASLSSLVRLLFAHASHHRGIHERAGVALSAAGTRRILASQQAFAALAAGCTTILPRGRDNSGKK